MNKGLKKLNKILSERNRIARGMTDMAQRVGINTGYKLVKARIREAAMREAAAGTPVRR